MGLNIGALVIGLISMITGALLSYFITTLSQQNMINKIAKSITDVHEKVHHQKPVQDLIVTHKSDCEASKNLPAIRSALIFLVTKQGGDIRDLGIS